MIDFIIVIQYLISILTKKAKLLFVPAPVITYAYECELETMKTFILLIAIGVTTLCMAEENIICAPSVCKDVKCPGLSEKCLAQNSTDSGLIFPSPTVCNCCKICLENLKEGDSCSVGTPSSPIPNNICGPGLYCKRPAHSDNPDGVCARMNTDCTKRQDNYDMRRRKGLLGQMEMRQHCDSEGFFAPYKCIPGQTCYCVDKGGNRIFGEIEFTGLPEETMRCQCSRDYTQAVSIIGRELQPSDHFRCAANGDYDTIQCIGDNCLCVDAEDGAPTYPDDPSVNITLLANSSLPCYNKIDHKEGFYKKCESEYMSVFKEVTKYKKLGVNTAVGFNFPKCDLDGTFQPLQENATHKICVDKEGEPILAIDKSTTLAKVMNCKCLRALKLMKSNTDLPQCDDNGNYLSKQCRRGTCWCVDENGNQVCNSEDCEASENEEDRLICS